EVVLVGEVRDLDPCLLRDVGGVIGQPAKDAVRDLSSTFDLPLDERGAPRVSEELRVPVLTRRTQSSEALFLEVQGWHRVVPSSLDGGSVLGELGLELRDLVFK